MKWYLATNEIDIFHYGPMEDDMETTTGQPKLFFYTTKEELINVLTSYGQLYQSTTIENIIPNDAPIELPTPD